MNFDPRTSPKSSAWLGLDDLSSFDSSPHFGAFGKRKSEQVRLPGCRPYRRCPALLLRAF
eukprot:COSAG03_NODE_9516_length_714_cov_0.539837_1_plen_59_part_01